MSEQRQNDSVQHLNWTGNFNLSAETGKYRVRIYLIYGSSRYAWVIDKHGGDGFLHGSEKTQQAAIKKAEAEISELQRTEP
jgi:hypothetical protein